MLHTTRAIVLRTFRHGDKAMVVHAYTERSGRRAYFARITAKGGIQASVLSPLNRIELVEKEVAERELHGLREARSVRPYNNIPFDPRRSAVLLFLQEVLYRVLREGSADPGLFGWLQEALEHLDQDDDLALFPLVFLLGFSRQLGFYPGPPEDGLDHFDLLEGNFTTAGKHSGHVMGPPLSDALAALLQGASGADAQAIPPALRRPLLDQLLLYFRLHHEGLGELRSPDVLHQVLG